MQIYGPAIDTWLRGVCPYGPRVADFLAIAAKSYGLFLATGRWVIYGILTCCHFYVVFKVPQPESETELEPEPNRAQAVGNPRRRFETISLV